MLKEWEYNKKPLVKLAVFAPYLFCTDMMVRVYLIDISPLIRLLILWPMLCMGRWIRRLRAATAVATVHRTVAESRFSNPSSQMPIPEKDRYLSITVFFWWGRTDSNHRSDTQQIYSLSPLATRELPHIQLARLEPVDGLGKSRCQPVFELVDRSATGRSKLILRVPCCLRSIGAGRRTRTPDLLITNQLLYQLSYTGVSNRTRIL